MRAAFERAAVEPGARQHAARHLDMRGLAAMGGAGEREFLVAEADSGPPRRFRPAAAPAAPSRPSADRPAAPRRRAPARVAPSASTTATAPRWRLSTSAPRITSTRTGLPICHVFRQLAARSCHSSGRNHLYSTAMTVASPISATPQAPIPPQDPCLVLSGGVPASGARAPRARSPIAAARRTGASGIARWSSRMPRRGVAPGGARPGDVRPHPRLEGRDRGAQLDRHQARERRELAPLRRRRLGQPGAAQLVAAGPAGSASTATSSSTSRARRPRR